MATTGGERPAAEPTRRAVLQSAALVPFALVGAQAREAKAAEILEDMAVVYRGCRTYRDTGVKTTTYLPDEEPGVPRAHTEKKPFTTAFVRPNRFRYEFRERSRWDVIEHRYLIWRDGAKVRKWWDITPGVREIPSLGEAINAATGVSGGTAQYVPGYLMPAEVKPWLMPTLRDLERIDDAYLGSALCRRITGRLHHGAPQDEDVTLWIDAKTHLLRRYEERTQHEGFRTEEITDYEPVLDEPIAEELLAFDPPPEPSLEDPAVPPR